MAATPFGPQLAQEFQSLLTEYDLPQGSVALIRNGQTFDYGATSNTFRFASAAPRPPVADNLFRLASISKTFTAMAVLKLQQDGRLSLNDSALMDLGYHRGETIRGRDPITGAPVSVELDDNELFEITVEELLQMTSGLQYNIPRASAAFRYATPGDVTGVAGNYAALGFAGVPRSGVYTTPASMSQLINYTLFEICKNPSLLATTPGTAYDYNNLSYGMLGMIVADKSGLRQGGPADRYMRFLDSQILKPMGISLAGDGPPTAAMVGLGSTLDGHQYPTEVHYYDVPSDTRVPGVIPRRAPMAGTLLPLPAGMVRPAYGGAQDLEQNFGDGGLVATPTALAIVMDNLNQVELGATTGPLTQQTVQLMISRPVDPLNDLLPADEANFGPGWFGMGLGVTSEGSSAASWNKNGDLPGTTTFFQRNPDGTVWAVTFDGGISSKVHSQFAASVQQVISDALYLRPIAHDVSESTRTNVPVAIDVLAGDTDPNVGGSLNPATLTIPSDDGPAHGSVFLDGSSGVVTYVPDANYDGTDSFSFVVSDDFGRTSVPASVTVQVGSAT